MGFIFGTADGEGKEKNKKADTGNETAEQYSEVI